MNLNFLKGMLIILVVIDHNDFARQVFPTFLLGMGFHVVGFMTIPFLKPAARVNTRDFAVYAFRLYYPFVLVTVGLWIVVTSSGQTVFLERLAMLAHVLYSGNADLLKRTVHMGLLWFLPSFVALVILRGLVEGGGRTLSIAGFIALASIHPFIGTLAKDVQDFLPFGLLPALYIYPLAFTGALLHGKFLTRLERGRAVLLTTSVFAAAKWAQMSLHLDNEIGFAAVASHIHPLAMLTHDFEAVAGTLMLFQIARYNLKGLVEKCGQYSMQIYLFHAFIALGIFKLATALFPQALPLYLLLATALATVLLTLLSAMLVKSNELLSRILFPRDPGELLGKSHRVPVPTGAPSKPVD